MKSFEDIKYGFFDEQILDVHIPDAEEFPVFIYFHGGGLTFGTQKQKFISKLVEKGIAVVSALYRKYPVAKYPDFIYDAAAVVNWTKKNIENYGKSKGIVVGGSSAGGYLTQMLCFDPKYLGIYGISNNDIAGYFHDAGQPTAHFNVLKERGIDSRRVIVDESAPLFHIKDGVSYPPMEIVVSDNDMENRYEQTMLLYSTLKHFRHDMSKVYLNVRENSKHCEYIGIYDEEGNSLFADMISDFVNKVSLNNQY